MILILAASLSAAAILVTLVRPKVGALLVWPVLFTYPHGLWSRHNPLPLNIGVDDVFILVLFVVVVLRLACGRRPRFEGSMWIVTGFVLVALVANYAGSLDAALHERILYYKDMMKMCVVWGLFFSLAQLLDTPRDVLNQWYAFCAAAVVGGCILIAQYFNPGLAWTFEVPVILETRIAEVGEIGARVAGPFMLSNTAAMIMGVTCVMVIALMRRHTSAPARAVLLSSVVVCLVAIMATGSRTGAIALMAVVIAMSFVGRSKRWGWFLLVVAVAAILVQPDMRQRLAERIMNTRSEYGTFDSSLAVRFKMWHDYFDTMTPRSVFFGRGPRAGARDVGMETHNAYVSAVTVYGLGGITWLLGTVTAVVSRIHRLRRLPPTGFTPLFVGAGWGLAIWALCGLMLDLLWGTHGLYVLFFLITLFWRSYALAYQSPAYSPHAPPAQSYILTSS